MSTSDVAWLADPNTRDFFMRFPLPLAVLDKDGNIKLLNKRFTGTYDGTCLKSDKLRQMLLSKDSVRQPITMLQCNDCQAEVYASSIDVNNDVILILDESADTTYTNELTELRERLAELEQLISNDRLTGAWNRNHFDKIIKMELSRSVRYRQPVALVFLDVDHFAQLNESHGQTVGNEVLRALARLITQNIRDSDMLFRWEGAQFAILAPSTTRHAAAILAETLRGKVEQYEMPGAGKITISLGAAEHVAGESDDTWFQRAQEALQTAKDSGRNCVIVDERSSSELWQPGHEVKLVPLTWQDSYRCGDANIDRQHRELFDLANTLVEAAHTRNDNPYAFNEAMQALLTHIEQHFVEEETTLARYHYANLDVQVRAHRRLLEHALQLRGAITTGAASAGELVDFLVNEVVAQHMLKTDREFHALFKEPPPFLPG